VNEQADKLRNLLEGYDLHQQSFFFERLHNPKVLDLLLDIGALTKAPAPYLEAGKTIYPTWPVTLYLKNIAPKSPERVTDVLQSVQTDNQRAIFELLNVAVALPSMLQARLVPTLISWLDRPHIEWMTYGYLDLIQSLFRGGQIDASLALARRVFKLLPRDALHIPELDYRSTDAVAEMGDVTFDHAIETFLHEALKVAPKETISLLADLLTEALSIEGQGADYSWIWAREIDQHLIGSGAKETLAYRVLQALRTTVMDGGLKLSDAMQLLQNRPEPVFLRMALIVVRDSGDLELARRAIARTDFMAKTEIQRERDQLLEVYYARLTQREQGDVRARIRAAIRSHAQLRTVFESEAADSDIAERIAVAQRHELLERLKPISPYLTGDEAGEYAALKDEFKTEEEFPQHGAVWVGPTSPRTRIELEEMSVDGIFDYVEEWRPTRGQFVPSPAGLGRELEPIVEKRMSHFLDRVDRILKLPPVYVWHVINALRKHVAEPGFALRSFLQLLDYARTRRADAEAGKFDHLDEADEEQFWGSTVQLIALALSDVFRSKVLTSDLRGSAWRALSTLLEDPSPTLEEDQRSESQPPWNSALNCVRGTAMLALFDYARWIHAQSGGEDGDPKDLRDAAPEVIAALDRHLDPSFDPSPAVRSTYGQNFVSIYAMTRSWTIPSIARIFPEEQVLQSLRDAAWHSYLVFNSVYDETFERLRPFYDRAVSSLSSDEHTERERYDHEGSLAAHVIRVYARGLVALDHNGLMSRFLERASSRVLGIAISSAGSAISTTGIPLEIWTRLQLLYDAILERYADRPPEQRRAALEPFGLWFIAPEIGLSWGLSALLRTLQSTDGHITFEFRVLERLAEISHTIPDATVRIALELLRGSVTSTITFGDSLRTILMNAVSAGGEAKKIAISVDNRLASLGVHQFRDVFGKPT